MTNRTARFVSRRWSHASIKAEPVASRIRPVAQAWCRAKVGTSPPATRVERNVIVRKTCPTSVGLRPDGTLIGPPLPYGYLSAFAPEDLAAVVLYLRSLPPPPDPAG